MSRTLIVLLIAAALPAAAATREHSRAATHGAIAYHAASNSSGYAVERPSSKEARVEALRQCGNPKCEVVATLRGDCGAVAKGARKTVSQKGTTRQEAEAKALRRCGEACEIVVWACTR